MRLNPLARVNDDNHPQLQGGKLKRFVSVRQHMSVCVCVGGHWVQNSCFSHDVCCQGLCRSSTVQQLVKIDFQSHQGDFCVANALDLLCCTWRFEVLNIMDWSRYHMVSVCWNGYIPHLCSLKVKTLHFYFKLNGSTI